MVLSSHGEMAPAGQGIGPLLGGTDVRWTPGEYRALDDAGGGSDRLAPEATAAALPISTGGDTYDMAWQYVGDYDWFRVHVPAGAAGATLHIEVCIDASAGSADSVAWLYRNPTSMTVMALNTNNATTCPGQGTRLDALIPTGGDNETWYAQVFEAGADATGRYTIRAWIDGLPGYQDDYWDAGSTVLAGTTLTSPVMDAAQPISNDAATGRMIASHFHAAGDRDMFRVDLAEGEHVTFTTENLRGANTILELYADTSAIRGYQRIPDPTRRWLQRDVNGGLEPLASRIHFVAPRAGRYYIRVLPYRDGMTPESPGSWTLHVQRMGNQAAALPQMP